MPSTYSSRLRLELQATGENNNTWGTITNTNLGTLLEEAIAGVAAVVFATDANYTITANNGATDEARRAVLSCTSSGSLTTTRDLIVPTQTKIYLVFNNTTGGQSILVKTVAGSGITIANGKKMLVYCNGTNVVDGVTALAANTVTTAAVTDDAITYAKIQDVAATSRFLGRITAGAGIVEELTAANAKTVLALAQADISGLTTADSPQFTAIHVGATDATVARVGAGDISVEGNLLYRAGGTDVPVTDGGTGSSTAAGAATNLGVGTGNSPEFTAVNVGHASDTTITRAVAGQLNVEAKAVIQHTSTSYTSGQVTFSTGAASGGSSGDIWFKYT